MPQVLHGSQNENYIDRSDEELIDMIRHNSDEGAVDYLINKYTGMVKKESRALYLIGGEREDLIQEGMIGLYKAGRNSHQCFDLHGNQLFYLCQYVCKAANAFRREHVKQEEAPAFKLSRVILLRRRRRGCNAHRYPGG